MLFGEEIIVKYFQLVKDLLDTGRN